MTTQTHMPLADPRYEHPLAAMPTAKVLLKLGEAEIGELVDVGELVCVDIRTPDAEKRELRILTASIAARQAGTREAGQAEVRSRAVWLVLGALGHDKPFVTGAEIKRVLNCGRQHVLNLIAAGALPAAPGTAPRRGRGGSPVVTRAAFAAFLTERML